MKYFRQLLVMSILLLAILFCRTRSLLAHGNEETEKQVHVELTPEQLPDNCLGDRSTTCLLHLKSPKTQTVHVEWKLNFDRRVWLRGRTRVQAEANQLEKIEFEFRTPPVKSGVVAGGTLAIRLFDELDLDLFNREYPVWVFHDNPFETDFAWLKQLPISIVDPDGKLTACLKKLGFPGPVDEEKNRKPKLLIVAQAKSWTPGIAEQIEQAVRDDQPVLCLSTGKASLKLPSDGKADDGHWPEIHGANLNYLTLIDSRLSTAQLRSASRCRLRQDPDLQFTLEIMSGKRGWDFMEYGSKLSMVMPSRSSSFAVPKVNVHPKLIYCGLDLLSNWDDSPTPRFLLAKLIERMCDNSEEQSKSWRFP